MTAFPDFSLIESHTAHELGIRAELRKGAAAWLVLQIDESGELIEARGCPKESQARAYWIKLLSALESDERALT